MEIIVGKMAGFCQGVENTVNKAEELLKQNKNVYCLGEIVHNGQVIKKLESNGMITVNSIEEIPNDSTVIFRAHGEAKSIYNKAIEKNLKVVDLTCGKVKSIHNKVEKYVDKAFIIIIGKKNHPEVIGTKGFCLDNSYIIEDENDILDAYIEYEKTLLGLVYIVSQTTFSSRYFDILSEEIKKNFYEADCIIDKTICMATEQRQIETREISKKVNSMVIIGGKHSSNTKELANVAMENCGKVYLIETVDELNNIDFSNDDKIGIMAGASTPKQSINEVVDYLNKGMN